MPSLKNLAACLAVVLSLCACGSAVTLDDSAQAGKRPQPQPEPHPVCCINPDSDTPPDPALANLSVYFDYDEYTVSEKYKSVVKAHADYLLSHRHRGVMISGNTDDRGGREYNLALGQKRAQTVADMLILLGVPAERIQAMSFGAERPRTEGDSEAAWADNRRVDFVY